MKPIALHILSKIQPADQTQPESISQELSGSLSIVDECWIIRYQEKDGEVEVRSKPDSLTIRREGEVAYQQVYHPQKKTESLVYTPAGEARMEVHTTYYQRVAERIVFAFQLRLGEELLGDYQLRLSWIEV